MSRPRQEAPTEGSRTQVCEAGPRLFPRATALLNRGAEGAKSLEVMPGGHGLICPGLRALRHTHEGHDLRLNGLKCIKTASSPTASYYLLCSHPAVALLQYSESKSSSYSTRPCMIWLPAAHPLLLAPSASTTLSSWLSAFPPPRSDTPSSSTLAPGVHRA